MMEPYPFEILLYYLYRPIADPRDYAERHRALCEELGLRGRIIVAAEGINGTVSGEVAATRRYRERLSSAPETRGIEFKIDPAGGHAFKKLSIKTRPEIVTLGLHGEKDVDPLAVTGERLSPQEFHDEMRRDDVVLLDGRNNYESALGKFEGAVCPDVPNFRDFPEWIQEHFGEHKKKRILAYCTGGIRCEKLTSWLLREGFEDVAQLDGGIIRYGQDEATKGEGFEGRCYVFDERVVVDVNRTDGNTVISHCRSCGAESDRYVNCAYKPCNAQIFLCPICEERDGRFCGPACRSAAGGVAGDAAAGA